MPRDYWHYYWSCPFFIGSEVLELQCEGGKITFPDKIAAKEFFKLCAAEENGWKECPICKVMWDYYERTETNEKGKRN